LKGFIPFLTVVVAILLYFGGRYLYFKPKFKSGDEPVEFTTQLLNGSEFRLSSLRGKYVLLDFWASWCGPCRMENPQIAHIYNEFRNARFEEADGFEVVGIAIEMQESSWRRAMAQDGLNWKYHIGQFDRFSSPLAKLYGVREVPTKYLIDTSGVIIMVNPTIVELRDFLSSKLQT